MKNYKKILAGILVLVLVVTGVYFDGVDGSTVLAAETTETVENSDYISIPYNQVNMETEIPTTDSEEYEDWIFAGWFTGEGCSKESALAETDTPDENCFAKFLPKEVLDVKVQTMNAYIQEGEVIAPNGAIRFVSSVDSLDYQYAGFHITYPDGTVKEHNIYKVLEKIDSNVMNKDTGKKVTYEFSPKIMDTKSEYFMTAKLAVDSTESDYVVKAFYKTLDGTTVYGESRCVSVNDGKSDTALSLSFKNVSDTEIKKDDLIDVTYGNGGTGTASVVGVDGQTVHVRITLKDAVKGDLPSATKFTFGTYGSAIYRNLYTKYNGSNADRTWYDVYDAKGDTEFIVATDADFYGMASVVNGGDTLEGKTVYLAKDIDANADDAMVWSTGTVNEGKTAYPWTPIGTKTNYFKGSFDGDGHVISGIYLTTNSTTYANGMFGYVVDAVIKNFELENSHYKGSGYVSSVVGEGDGTLAHIKCADSVHINSTSFIVGGIFCYVRDNTASDKVIGTNCYINDCWFDGNITVNYTGSNAVRVGTMVAYKTHGTVIVNNGLFTGDIDATLTSTDNSKERSTMVGGIFGTQNNDKNGSITIQDCLSAGTITAEAIQQGTKPVSVMAGAVYGGGTCPQTYVNVYGLTDENCTKALGHVEDKPEGVILSDDATSLTLSGLAKSLYWENCSADVPALKYFANRDSIANDYEWLYESAGDGQDSYKISNIKELVSFESLVNDKKYTFKGDTVVLANSVTANKGIVDNTFKDETESKEKTWTPIGTRSSMTKNDGHSFKGTFDGAGYSISGLYVNAKVPYSGLFGFTQDCTIQNLRLLNSYFTTEKECMGSVSGGGDGTFKNIYSEVDLNASNYIVGGIIGRVSDTTTVATTQTLVENCWYNGDITQEFNGQFMTGGIIGYVTGGFVAADEIYQNIIRNSLYTGSITFNYIGTSSTQSLRIGGLCGGNTARTTSELLIDKSVSAGSITPIGSNGANVGSVIGFARANGNASASNNVTMCTDVYASGSYGLNVAGDDFTWATAQNIDFTDDDALTTALNTLNGSNGTTWIMNVAAEKEADKLVLSEFCVKKAWAKYDANMSYENGTEGLAIYLPTENGYVNYNFVHTVTSNDDRTNTKANSDMWRLSVANLCDDNSNVIKQITRTGAEWEMAIYLAERTDFIGGFAHGDERIIDGTLKVTIDGKEKDVTAINRTEFESMSIAMDSEGFDPSDGTTRVLRHHKEYTITKAGISLDQTITWYGDYTLDRTKGSFLAMMPPLKYSLTDSEDIITDSYYTDLNTQTVTLGTTYPDEMEGVNSVCVFGQDSGIYFTMSKSNVSPECNDGNSMILTDNGGINYNKMYFIFARDCSVSSGDVWTATTNYNIEWK